MKCFPSSYGEEDIKKLFKEFGELTFVKVETDLNKRKFAFVIYSTPESALKAKEAIEPASIS